jgi:citrate lyase beta subunit
MDRIMVDLERLGKAQRQSGRSLFLSHHEIGDVARIRQCVTRGQVMVRINPIHWGSRQEIDRVIQQGADILMLPYFHSLGEVSGFLDLVRGRASAVLLVETAASLAILPQLCKIPQVAEIHIGLNDLSISLRRQSHFDVIADGTIEHACRVLRSSGLPFGFGGIASLSRRDLPVRPELMLAAQVCEGATRGWLGRTFRDVSIPQLPEEVALLREAIERHRFATQLDRDFVTSELRGEIAAQSLITLDAA